jgi:nucleotide-binding universal stress UspA family protein
MKERILVAFDGTPLAKRALECAVRKHPEDQITVLYVLDPMYAVYEAETEGLPAASTWYDRVSERAEAVLSEATVQAEESDCRITTATASGAPARTILDYAEEHDADHIIMGSHGRDGISRVVLGSVAERVMRRAPIPVTIVR